MKVVAIVVLSTAVLSAAPKSKSGRAVFVLSAIAAAALLVMIDGPIARWLAMLIGVPSISSLALLTDLATTRVFDRPLFARNERNALLWTMAVVALVLYPTALGYINVDLYRLGFTTAAPLVIAVAGIALALRRNFRLAIVAAIALVALDVQLLPSSNVFDYVVDPIGGLFAVAWVSARTLMASLAGAIDAKRQSSAAGRRPAPQRAAG